jgi:hypothetical protein
MDFVLKNKTIYISYIVKDINESSRKNFHRYHIIKFSDNSINIHFSDYIEVTEYSYTVISENIFYLNWNEEGTETFVSMFLNILNRNVNIITFSTRTGVVNYNEGIYTILDENIVSEKHIDSFIEKVVEKRFESPEDPKENKESSCEKVDICILNHFNNITSNECIRNNDDDGNSGLNTVVGNDINGDLNNDFSVSEEKTEKLKKSKKQITKLQV